MSPEAGTDEAAAPSPPPGPGAAARSSAAAPDARAAFRLTPAAALLAAAGVLLGLAAVSADLLSLLRPGEAFDPSLGLYQLSALGLAWVLVTRGLVLAAGGPAAAAPAPRAGARVAELVHVGGIALQVALLVAVLQGFAIESPAFHDVLAPLIVAGFVLHELTPAAYRMRFFVALSISALYLVLGWNDALWLVALGAGLIGLCHVPVPFPARVVAIVAVGGVLAALRTGGDTLPWSRAVWPIFGSIFMFRLIAYLYDLKHGKVAPGLAHRLGYFFLLPNVAFPLFPVVDYSAYRRGYYARDRRAIYQKGIEWMVRGTIQLLLYRLVYQQFTIGATAVATWDQLARYVLSTFLLYVRVSGQFHLIVGILHLFGLDLPETHKRYYLSGSFTDFWRRINIYWKDFMMKVVYYPTFFRLRRHGATSAMVVATLLVFFTTWALHSYQWFWLLGSFPVTWTDGLFWGVLAVILVVDALREARTGRTRVLGARRASARELAARALRVGATFVVISLLWSLWMSPSLGSWVALWRNAEGLSADPGERAIPLLLLGGMGVYGALAALVGRWRAKGSGRDAWASAGAIVLLYGASLTPSSVLPERGERVAEALRTGELSQEDVTLLTRGYYEDLMGVSRFNSQLWEVYMRRPPARDWPAVWQTEAGRERGDFLRIELVPSKSIVYLGEPFSTNQWAMRDRDYPALPPPGARRIALMGASVEMGWGVGDGETFEAVLEERLARERPYDTEVEVLNFAIGSYKLPQQLVILERVLSFQPHVLLFAAHEIDAREAVGHLIERRAAGVEDIPFDTLRRLAAGAGLGVEATDMVRPRLEAHAAEVESWAYGEIVRACRERGILPVWVFVPMSDRRPGEWAVEMERRARDAGFLTLDLAGAFEGIDTRPLRLTEFDYHPNARGHVILADELFDQLVRHPEILTGTADPAAQPPRSPR